MYIFCLNSMRKKNFSFFLYLILFFSFSFPEDIFYYDTFCNNSIARLFARKAYCEPVVSHCEEISYNYIFRDIDLDKIDLVIDQYMINRILDYGERHKEDILRCIEKIDISNVPHDVAVDVLIRQGLAYISKGLFEDAISIFEKLKCMVEDERMLMYIDVYIAFCYFYLERYNESSFILLERYNKQHDDKLDPMFLCLLAISLYYNHATDKLLEIYGDDRIQKVLDDTLNETGFMYAILGDIFLSQKDYSQALARYDLALKSKLNVQQHDLLLLKIAFSKYKLGSVEESLDAFLCLSSLKDMIGSIACFYVGYIYIQQGDYNKSLFFFTQAYKSELLNEDCTAVALFFCGVCNFFLGAHDEALLLLETFVDRYKNHPLSTTASRLIVDINVPDYDYSKVISSFEKGESEDLSLKLISQREYFYKAVECYERHDYKSCLNYCLKSLKCKCDDSINSLNVLLCAEAYYSLKSYNEAINYFEEFLSAPVMKYKEHVIFLLGYCFYVTGNYGRALEVLLQSDLQHLPVDVGDKIADCFFKLERYKEAAEWYSKYVDINTFYLFRYGLSLFLSGDKENAKHVFARIIRDNPSSRFFNEAVSFYYKCLDDYSFNVLCADENLTKEMIVDELSKKDSIFVTNVDVLDDIFKRLGYEKDKHDPLL